LRPSKSGRLVIIPVVKDAFATLSVLEKNKKADTVLLHGATDPKVELNFTPETLIEAHDTNVYNMPFLFNKDLSPWMEANDYLMDQIVNAASMSRPTDDLRKRASRILQYKMYLEDKKIDWLDFSGKRRSHRPTYKYFHHLVVCSGISNVVINQHTGAIYNFYEHVSKYWHPIDIARVDEVAPLNILVLGGRGARVIKRQKRTQTRPSKGVSQVPMGHVRDEGEDLQPLQNKQLAELVRIISGKDWSQQERLIAQTAYMTGARKQSLLTLRMKHLELFTEDRLCNDGTYKIITGPGTGIDTKQSQKRAIYIPAQLAEDLKVYASSKFAKSKREKFKEAFVDNAFGVDQMDDRDIYVFLSDQGNCYYMSKDDPRYKYVLSKPEGQVTGNITKKIIVSASENFPRHFVFHWLRATFGLQYYQYLIPLVESGIIKVEDLIPMVQSRMGHKDRKITEHYLKLFENIDEKFEAQNKYEKNIFRVITV
jgi:integrase